MVLRDQDICNLPQGSVSQSAEGQPRIRLMPEKALSAGGPRGRGDMQPVELQ